MCKDLPGKTAGNRGILPLKYIKIHCVSLIARSDVSILSIPKKRSFIGKLVRFPQVLLWISELTCPLWGGSTANLSEKIERYLS